MSSSSIRFISGNTYKHIEYHFLVLQGVSQLTVIYNIQNTQIWVITQEIFFIFRNHRKINFHLKVSEGNLDHILCPKMHNFGIGQFQLLGYQISAKFKK